MSGAAVRSPPVLAVLAAAHRVLFRGSATVFIAEFSLFKKEKTILYSYLAAAIYYKLPENLLQSLEFGSVTRPFPIKSLKL